MLNILIRVGLGIAIIAIIVIVEVITGNGWLSCLSAGVMMIIFSNIMGPVEARETVKR